MASRPGLATVSQLPYEQRSVLEPLCDIMLRITAVTTPPIADLLRFGDRALDPATATLAQTIARLNDIQVKQNEIVDKVNEVITRLQED